MVSAVLDPQNTPTRVLDYNLRMLISRSLSYLRGKKRIVSPLPHHVVHSVFGKVSTFHPPTKLNSFSRARDDNESGWVSALDRNSVTERKSLWKHLLLKGKNKPEEIGLQLNVKHLRVTDANLLLSEGFFNIALQQLHKSNVERRRICSGVALLGGTYENRLLIFSPLNIETNTDMKIAKTLSCPICV